MTQPRTQDTDTSSWTPFGADEDRPPTGTDTDTSPSTGRGMDTGTDGKPDSRPSTGRSMDGHPSYLRVIDGGHAAEMDVHAIQDKSAPSEDTSGLDAAVDEAIATITDTDTDAAAEPAPSTPVQTPAAAAAETTAPSTVKTTAETPAQGPAETAPEPDSTPHTPHPDQEATESENAAHAGSEAAETPHSTPAWRTAAAALNPSGVLFRQQASLAEIVAYADRAPYSTNRAVRGAERTWNRAVAVPVSLVLYTTAAAYKRLWRGLGTSAIGVLWIVTVHAAPVDTAAVWTWVVLGYWAVSALIVPVIVTKK